jgi:endonuclease/exonuclease/phosphatase family metal-dependent hydrolase
VLRIATWNVHLGMRLARVIEEMAGLPPLDLIALQEVSEHGGRPDAEVIAESLGPTFRAWQVNAQRLRGMTQANALVWDSARFELASSDVLDLPLPEGRLMRRLPPSRRNALIAEGCIGRRRVRVACVHLDVLGIAHKHAQLGRVLDEMAGRPPVDLALIAGDLNTYGVAGTVRWTRLRGMAAQRGFRELTTRIRWTHAAAGVRQKLDAVFAAPPGLGHRVRALPTDASDHRPVVVELDW